MTPLPVISGDDLIRALAKLGYEVARQRGSHARLRCSDASRNPVTVPRHRELRRGTLMSILPDVDITPEELQKLLR